MEGDRPGVRRRPVDEMLGVRASLLADLEFDHTPVPVASLLGRPGFGGSNVVGTALHEGRYTVAWGCLGVATACLASTIRYAAERRQFGAFLDEHQLVQRMITDMVVGVESVRLLCRRAAELRQVNPDGGILATTMAKYAASTALSRIAADAVQIHGANGCSGRSAIQRYFRDAKIMEIIEGTTQMHQIMIAQQAKAYALDTLEHL